MTQAEFFSDDMSWVYYHRKPKRITKEWGGDFPHDDKMVWPFKDLSYLMREVYCARKTSKYNIVWAALRNRRWYPMAVQNYGQIEVVREK